MSEQFVPCNALMASQGGGGYIYCNSQKGHDGPHAHTYPPMIVPGQPTEMTSLREIKANLDGLRQDVNVLSGQIAQLDRAIKEEIGKLGAAVLLSRIPKSKHKKR